MLTRKSRKHLALISGLVIAGVLFLAGCGGKGKPLSEKELANILPEDITAYDMYGRTYMQDVKDRKVVKRNTDDDSDFVECEITLEDDNMKRTVYVDLYLTNYETGGWLIDSWYPYQMETAQAIAPPEPAEVQERILSEYNEAVLTDTDTSQVSSGVCVNTYEINDSHKYVDFAGTIVCTSTFGSNDPAEYGCRASYYWSHDLERTITDRWKIEGEWLLTEMGDDLPDKVYISLQNYNDDTKKCDVTAYYAFPCHDGFSYMGYYGTYTVNDSQVGISYVILSANAAYWKVTLGFYNGVELEFHPDDIEVSVQNLDHHDFELVKVEDEATYDAWNNFPKGSEYSFPTSR